MGCAGVGVSNKSKGDPDAYQHGQLHCTEATPGEATAFASFLPQGLPKHQESSSFLNLNCEVAMQQGPVPNESKTHNVIQWLAGAAGGSVYSISSRRAAIKNSTNHMWTAKNSLHARSRAEEMAGMSSNKTSRQSMT